MKISLKDRLRNTLLTASHGAGATTAFALAIALVSSFSTLQWRDLSRETRIKEVLAKLNGEEERTAVSMPQLDKEYFYSKPLRWLTEEELLWYATQFRADSEKSEKAEREYASIEAEFNRRQTELFTAESNFNGKLSAWMSILSFIVAAVALAVSLRQSTSKSNEA